MATGPSIPGIRQPACEVHDLSPYSADDNNEWTNTSSLPYAFFQCGRTTLPYNSDQEELPRQIPDPKNTEHITLL